MREFEVVLNLFLAYFKQDSICRKNRSKRAFPPLLHQNLSSLCRGKGVSHTQSCGLDLSSMLKTGKVASADLNFLTKMDKNIANSSVTPIRHQ